MPSQADKSAPERIRVFAYLDAEKAALYQLVMRAFMVARDSFRLHLRPVDVLDALPRDDGLTVSEIDAALVQLCEWGNLVRHPDTTEVATVEEFYRPRFLFQLTVRGEAAEHALAFFERELRKPGELQTAALRDIRAHLSELATLAEEPSLDPGKVGNAFVVLRERFHSLTDRAQAFLGSLQRGIDLHGFELEQFLRYKERLIEYLDRFIQELVVASSEIADLVAKLESSGIDRLLGAAAARELENRLEATEEERAAALLDWRRRWDGLRAWFVPSRGRPAQAEVLRASARSAIVQFLAALGGINDRRITRSDRAQDFRTLARWFAECPDDGAAHALWRAAFGLSSARHLSVDPATLAARDQQAVASSESWLKAPPLLLSPRLRASGKHSRPGRANSVIDRSEAKSRLSHLAQEAQARLAEAEARIATGIPFRLSALGQLRRAEFDLLLELLGDALGQPAGRHTPAEATSADGTLLIRIEPPAASAELALLRTDDGALAAPDFLVTVRRVSASAPAVRERAG